MLETSNFIARNGTYKQLKQIVVHATALLKKKQD
jgi:hypothetical protein